MEIYHTIDYPANIVPQIGFLFDAYIDTIKYLDKEGRCSIKDSKMVECHWLIWLCLN